MVLYWCCKMFNLKVKCEFIWIIWRDLCDSGSGLKQTGPLMSRTSGQNGVGITFETVWVLYPPSWNVLHQLAVDFRFWVSTCCITADYCITGQIQYGRKQTCSTVTLEWGETLVIWWMNRLVQVFLQVCSQMSHCLKPRCYSCEIMTCFCNKDNSECLLYNLYF